MIIFFFASNITFMSAILVIVVSLGICEGNPKLSVLSKGCDLETLPEGIVTDKLIRRHITVNDPRLNYPLERQFLVRVPGETSALQYREKGGHQLMIYFHGFMGNAWDVATKYEYSLMSTIFSISSKIFIF